MLPHDNIEEAKESDAISQSIIFIIHRDGNDRFIDSSILESLGLFQNARHSLKMVFDDLAEVRQNRYLLSRVLGLVFLVHLQTCMANAGKETVPISEAGVKDALLALEKAIIFYSNNFEKVNLDSIFGVRVAQGSLYHAIISLKSKGTSQEILEKTEELHSKFMEVADKGYEKLKSSKSGYFETFKYLIDKEWFYFRPYQHGDITMFGHAAVAPTYDNYDMFDSGTSDECFSQLIGNNGNELAQNCQITDKCLTLMTDKRATGYYLTHQALYMALAEKQGCKQEVLRRLQNEGQWEKNMQYLGSKISLDMQETYKRGFDAEQRRDLFTEQVVVCQMLGILECFDERYLALVMQWQENTGCWKEPANEEAERDDTDNEPVARKMDNAEEPDNEAKDENEVVDVNNGLKDVMMDNGDETVIMRRLSRKLNEEKILSDGCASHLTGVATGLIGMYIYWFSNPYKAEISHIVNNPSRASQMKIDSGTSKSHRNLSIDAKWGFIFIFVGVVLYVLKRWIRTRRRFLKRGLKLSL